VATPVGAQQTARIKVKELEEKSDFVSTPQKVNILMVDDQPSKLMSYEAILNELGDNLIKASSGREALEHLLRSDIAVVLMDVSMPELDGFELAEMIRQHPRYQNTAIIFISAIHMSDIDRLRGYAQGAVDYISVPVVPELLRAKVSVFAELHRRTRQLGALNDELRVLSQKLINTQDEERRRIARELHDSLGQELSAAKMLSDTICADNGLTPTAKKAAIEMSSLIDHTIQQVRSISYLLHPPLLDEIGLKSALEWYVEGLTKRSGIEISIQFDPPEFPRLAPEIEMTVFRIVQEALTNVFRHAEAHKAEVMVTLQDNEVLTRICDDGKGIEPLVSELQPQGLGVGIAGMKQRVKEFGGTLKLVRSDPGTIVQASIPAASVVARAGI
jgi:signal transduction histidine kinase